MVSEGTASPKTLAGWWKIQGRRFLIATAVTTVTLVVSAWMSGLRQIMHGALLTFAIAALLPFVIVAGGLLMIMAIGFILALAAALARADDVPLGHRLYGAGEAVVEGGGWLIPRYYRFLGRQRHPAFWGVPAGLLFGGLLLWALIAALVIPGETRTARTLTETTTKIERVYGQSGGFPQPDDRGHLTLEGIDAAQSTASGVLEDGFGRPFKYEVAGRRKLASWTLTSLGFDGKTSADDLCVSGSTKLVEWAEKGEHVARLLRDIQSGSAPIDTRLAGIRAFQCPDR